MNTQEFISKFSLSKSKREAISKKYELLKEVIQKNHSKDIIEIFHHGSIARETEIILPEKGSDFDVLVLIKRKEESVIKEIQKSIKSYTEQNSYSYRTQKKSLGIIEFPSQERIDLVIGVPKEGVNLSQKDQWKNHPIEIKDHENDLWIESNPFYFQNLVEEKNKQSDGAFSLTVKLFKLWQNRIVKCRPSGFALEMLVSKHFDTNIKNIQDQFESILEKIQKENDPKKVPELLLPKLKTNVLKKVKDGHWENFMNLGRSAINELKKDKESFFKNILNMENKNG
ncbi:MAG: hypothetical protein SFU98_02140 [Leptospiraceae bacterium]|nr:hypothetical protein [Leptospiraceae bacterium]